MVSRPIAIASALPIALATSAQSQIRASERGAVSQTVDGTVITVDYSRLSSGDARTSLGL